MIAVAGLDDARVAALARGIEAPVLERDVYKRQVKNSIRNCLTVFQRDPLFRGALRLNLLTEQIDICLLYTSGYDMAF